MQQEIKYGGFTATPDDYSCPDGDIAAMANLIHEQGALRPVLPPKTLPITISASDGVPIAVHETREGTHYILLASGNRTLKWILKPAEGATATSPTDITNAVTVTSDITSVIPVGNTLVALTGDGVHYYLWNGSTYVHLGNKLPSIDITFGLDSKFCAYPGFKGDGTATKPIEIKGESVSTAEFPMPYWHSDEYGLAPKPVMESIDDSEHPFSDYDYSLKDKTGTTNEDVINAQVSFITNRALAAVNKFIASEGHEKGRFVFPFFVRYAIELYDGSMVMHSYPVLMIPNSRGPIFGLNSSGKASGSNNNIGESNGLSSNSYPGLVLDYDAGPKMHYIFRGRVYGFTSQLYYEFSKQDLSKWSDIIKGVKVFVTPPIYSYDQAGKVYGWKNMDDEGAWDSYYTIGRLKDTNYPTDQDANARLHWKRWQYNDVFPSDTKNGTADLFEAYSSSYPDPSYILALPEHDKEEYHDSIAEAFNFRLIHEFKFEDISGTGSVSGDIDIKDGVLQSLASREQLSDDYHSRDTLVAGTAFAFNGRVNLAGMKTKLHNPLNPYIQWAKYAIHNNISEWDLAMTVKNGSQTNVIKSGIGQNGIPFPLYIFYPNTAAKEVIAKHGTDKWKLPLKEHANLEGAYWLGDLWNNGGDTNYSDKVFSGDWPAESNAPVPVLNKIYTSEVNNPFYFPLLGINTVGTGEIYGICAAVKALSQGQFGQFPLYAFTSEGVWALQTNSEGSYSAVQPVTRDVCIDPGSITQMDDAVLFVTDRGIMLISGSTSQCISEVIDGRDSFTLADMYNIDAFVTGLAALTSNEAVAPLTMVKFKTFLNGARFIYDYTHQRIIVYNATMSNGALAYPYAYIYSLESHKWGIMQSNLKSSLNEYPEAIAVTTGNALVDMSGEQTGNGVKFTLVTRPLKLGAADVHKTVTDIIQRGVFKRGDVKTILFGSRDLRQWFPISSSVDHYLRGFSGTPYKYFRIVLMGELAEDESITGCTIQFEPRQTNRLR